MKQELWITWLSFRMEFAPAWLSFQLESTVVSLTLTAVQGVKAQEAGIASALLNASQQIGVAFGLAILSTIAVSTTNGLMPDALQKLHHGRATVDAVLLQDASNALISGYGTALASGSLVIVLGAVIAAIFVNEKATTR